MPSGGRRPNQTGRPVGSRNKATAPIREAIDAYDPVGKLMKLHESLYEDVVKGGDDDGGASVRVCVDPDLAHRILGTMLPYAYPRLAASQIDLKAALMGDTEFHLHPPAKK